MTHYKQEKDHLAIGLTKAPLFMGVNLKLFFLNLSVCALICVDAHTVLGIPLFFMLHLILFKLSLNEPCFLYLWLMALIKTPPVLNSRYWGKVNSYMPG